MVNRELATDTQGTARIRALGRNHTLWSILVKDLALADNRLPDALKAELIGLGLWSMRYSTLAMLQHLPAEPLIEVNRNIADGLLAQGGIGQQAQGVLKAALSI
jgi:flagellar protein FlaF